MIHVDGDAIVYIAGFSADSRNGLKSHALHNTKLILEKVFKVFDDTQCKVFLTNKDPKVNFRTVIYPEYKKNRKKTCRSCRSTNLSKAGFIESEPTDNGLFRRRLFKCLDCTDGTGADNKPVYYQAIRNYLIKKYKAVVVKWGEADDWFHGSDIV